MHDDEIPGLRRDFRQKAMLILEQIIRLVVSADDSFLNHPIEDATEVLLLFRCGKGKLVHQDSDIGKTRFQQFDNFFFGHSRFSISHGRQNKRAFRPWRITDNSLIEPLRRRQR